MINEPYIVDIVEENAAKLHKQTANNLLKNRAKISLKPCLNKF